jgi:Fe-S-cluster-containing dehydrogenase component/formate-dependent nitrite reductase membrane component NrfD
VRYGFVIDQRTCIGCHACTVACKEENQVPLGAFRTWVKYVERGHFPRTRRYFAVLRCNHCDDAPCVVICPTVALYRRPDGIVDFDGARCIGCKSCLQACPYDALYIDPDAGTAAKCNYCAHRVEVGLEPACVIVCPQQAIVSGDLDDPASHIARLVATEPVQVRKPEQGTRPKVFYVGADAAVLAPSLHRPSAHHLWGDRPREEVSLVRMVAAADRAPDAGPTTRSVYDAPHLARPWGWKVATYLWTKAIAAGSLMVSALGVLLGGAGEGPLSRVVAPSIALGFLMLTALLLILDLKRPERFLYILTRPNPRSWLVLGAWILIAYGGLAGLWLVTGLTGAVPPWLPLPTLLLAGATAGYSALLFGQAEGRDFWQSPLRLPHLLATAVLSGAASLILAVAVTPAGAPALDALGAALMGSLGLTALTLFADLLGRHPGLDGARAARLLWRGPLAARFWWGAVVVGLALPLVLAATGGRGLGVAAALALGGLWIYEDLWVRAGQSVPLS